MGEVGVVAFAWSGGSRCGVCACDKSAHLAQLPPGRQQCQVGEVGVSSL